MPKKLKCWQGNLDGVRQGLVMATSQKSAAAIATTSLHSFRDYWGECHVMPDLQANVLYTRPYSDLDAPWVEGRCPVSRSR